MPNKQQSGSKQTAKKLRDFADNAYKNASSRSKKTDRRYSGKPTCSKCGDK